MKELKRFILSLIYLSVLPLCADFKFRRFLLQLRNEANWKQSSNRSYDEKDGSSTLLGSDAQLEAARWAYWTYFLFFHLKNVSSTIRILLGRLKTEIEKLQSEHNEEMIQLQQKYKIEFESLKNQLLEAEARRETCEIEVGLLI